MPVNSFRTSALLVLPSWFTPSFATPRLCYPFSLSSSIIEAVDDDRFDEPLSTAHQLTTLSLSPFGHDPMVRLFTDPDRIR